MKKYGLFEAIFLSFYSKALYRDIAASWGGYAILYLLMIVTLSWVGAAWHIQSSLSRTYKKDAYAFFSQFPIISIKNGVLSTSHDRPFIIKTPREEEVLAIIDTTGKYTDINNTTVALLVTKNNVQTKSDNKNETRVYQLPKNYTGTIVPYNINRFIGQSITFLFIPLLFAASLFSFAYRIIQAFLYALIGKAFNYFFYGANLTYGQITQIAMVAITPTIVLTAVNDLLNIHYKYQLLLYFLLSILYICYGIVANGKNNVKEST